MKDVKKGIESDSLTKLEGKGLLNSSIDSYGEERYNSRYLEKERGRGEKKEADNCLSLINVLHKKGIINMETYMEVERKYRRKI